MYNEAAVVVALTHVFFGYMVISLLTILRRIDDTLYDAAANLGASRLRMFVADHAAAQPSRDHGRLDAGLHAQRRALTRHPRWSADRA